VKLESEEITRINGPIARQRHNVQSVPKLTLPNASVDETTQNFQHWKVCSTTMMLFLLVLFRLFAQLHYSIVEIIIDAIEAEGNDERVSESRETVLAIDCFD
jgi:hypothetical protein